MNTILVSLAQLNRVDDVIDMASFLAQKNQSHVIGFYPVPGPSLIAITHPGTFMPLDDRLQKHYLEQESKTRSKFEDRMRREGLNFEWRSVRLAVSETHQSLAEHGREADLVIVAQDAPTVKGAKPDISRTSDIVQDLGRPLLIVPPTQKMVPILDKVVIGWDGSREAARAAFDAIPLLKLARKSHILCINPTKEMTLRDELPGTELAAALSRHGVNVVTDTVKTRKRVDLALLERSENADLLVIGAYGHSRLRETILGGVTASTLAQMRCPVLMSN